jgi:F-type H+-transporting ATPase subunit b
MTKVKHAFRRDVPGVLLACLFLLFPLAVAAQEHKPEPAGSNGKAEPQASESRPEQASSFGAQLAKETREAAGEEDETAAFRQSAAVRFVSRLTGLSLGTAYWLCVVLNFVVIAAAIFWFSRSSLLQLFRNRSEAIRKAMDEARRASEDANRRLSDIENRLSRLDSEIAGMRAAAEQEAAAEEQRIRAAAEEDKRRIVEGAEQEIAAAAKLARRELTAFVAGLAVSLAEKKIAVDERTDETLVRNFADRLSDGKDGR